MTPKVGVLSVVCAVAVGALAFKGVDIAQAVAAETAENGAPAAADQVVVLMTAAMASGPPSAPTVSSGEPEEPCRTPGQSLAHAPRHSQVNSMRSV